MGRGAGAAVISPLRNYRAKLGLERTLFLARHDFDGLNMNGRLPYCPLGHAVTFCIGPYPIRSTLVCLSLMGYACLQLPL